MKVKKLSEELYTLFVDTILQYTLLVNTLIQYTLLVHFSKLKKNKFSIHLFIKMNQQHIV